MGNKSKDFLVRATKEIHFSPIFLALVLVGLSFSVRITLFVKLMSYLTLNLVCLHSVLALA